MKSTKLIFGIILTQVFTFAVSARSFGDTSRETIPAYVLINCTLSLSADKILVGTDKGLYHIARRNSNKNYECLEVVHSPVKGLYKISDSLCIVLTEHERITLYLPSGNSDIHWQVVGPNEPIADWESENSLCIAHYEVCESKIQFINGDVVSTDANSLLSESAFKDIANKIKIMGGFAGLSSIEQMESKDPSELIYFRHICDRYLLAIFSRHGISYYFNPEGTQTQQAHEDGFYAMHFINTDGGPKPVKYLRFAQ